jgi:hypothetical protein
MRALKSRSAKISTILRVLACQWPRKLFLEARLHWAGSAINLHHPYNRGNSFTVDLQLLNHIVNVLAFDTKTLLDVLFALHYVI